VAGGHAGAEHGDGDARSPGGLPCLRDVQAAQPPLLAANGAARGSRPEGPEAAEGPEHGRDRGQPGG